MLSTQSVKLQDNRHKTKFLLITFSSYVFLHHLLFYPHTSKYFSIARVAADVTVAKYGTESPAGVSLHH